MSTYNPCLIIVFNHKYDKNISRLEEIYSSKFKNIFFLVPFYTGDNPRVIPVYESSFYFQGYFAQGYTTFYRPEFTHYFFIGDDLILNPTLNETNYAELLGLEEGASYLPEINTLRGPNDDSTPSSPKQRFWVHTIRGIDFYGNRRGSETKHELPSYEEVLQKLASHGVEIRPLSYGNIFGPLTMPSNFSQVTSTARTLWTYYWTWRHRKVQGDKQQLQLQYPLVFGYSDVIVISKQVIERFCHLCGVFAAMGLFVEMAVPTALLLSTNNILTDEKSKLKGTPLWGDDITKLEEKYKLNLEAMMADFPKSQLHYHPVKLSRWQ
jgi:hypothetical protein